MLNSVKELLNQLGQRNAMEVLPALDQIVEEVLSLKDKKVEELISFASNYGIDANVKAIKESNNIDTKALEEKVMNDAKQQANEFLENAKQQVEGMITQTLEQAEIEAQTIVDAAKIEAVEIIAKAKSEADLLVDNAKLVASSVNISEKVVTMTEEKIAVQEETTEEVVEEQHTIIEEEEVIEEDYRLIDMEDDKRNKNCHVGYAQIGTRIVTFHSAPYMSMPLVYNANEGDEAIVKELIINSFDNDYFRIASINDTYRYINYDDNCGMYKNKSGIYVGYIDGYAISWNKATHKTPSYLPCKYVNKKGFKPVTKADFVEKVNTLIDTYETGYAIDEARAKELKEQRKNQPFYTFAENSNAIVEPLDVEIKRYNEAPAALVEAFGNLC